MKKELGLPSEFSPRALPGLIAPSYLRTPSDWYCCCVHKLGAKTTHVRTMLRLTVLVASIACCSSFLVPPVALRSANRMETSTGLHMMTHKEHSNVDEPYFPGEVAVDRRTLLQAVPATLVAGKSWHDTGRLGKARFERSSLILFHNFSTLSRFAHVSAVPACRLFVLVDYLIQIVHTCRILSVCSVAFLR